MTQDNPRLRARGSWCSNRLIEPCRNGGARHVEGEIFANDLRFTFPFGDLLQGLHRAHVLNAAIDETRAQKEEWQKVFHGRSASLPRVAMRWGLTQDSRCRATLAHAGTTNG